MMTLHRVLGWNGVLLLLAVATPWARGAEPEAKPSPPVARFEEIYSLVRTNLGGLSAVDLDRMAVEGLLNELGGLVVLGSESTNGPAVPAISKTNLFDNAYAYFRVGQVRDGLAGQFSTFFQQMTGTARVKGILFDLRFAQGTNYAAAAELASRFLGTEQPLLNWGSGLAKSSNNPAAIRLPVAVLINRQTGGAAEALASVLRETQVSLLIGSASAGNASIFREFTLKNGQRLRIATDPIQVAGGKTIPVQGLKPDIEVALTPEEEKAFFEDAYRQPRRVLTVGAGVETNAVTGVATARPPRRRLNEAELVRLQREGLNPDADVAPGPAARFPETTRPALADPALVRALDLLKGLAVVQPKRPL